MSSKKNIFVKNNNLSNNILSDNDSDESNNLSDELNSIFGLNNKANKLDSINKEDLNNKHLNKQDLDKENNFFDITNIFKNISSILNLHSNIKILGEITSFKITDSNAWINIKTDDYEILTVFWKITQDKNYNKLKITKPGDKFIFEGKFAMMKKNLKIYFNTKSMIKFGKGDYLNIYDEYRIKIKELGLGIPKKELKIFPSNIGIITALGGAAIQDILQTLKLDKFIGKIIIKNALVQGTQCPQSIINSIEWFEYNYNQDQIDLLFITRGGGSWEDLIGFSDWNVIIKLNQCKFITLSAVGHQIDNQLTDEICDYKFATPSIGAKFIVETQQKYLSYISEYKNIIKQYINSYELLKDKFNSSIVPNYDNFIKKYDLKNTLFKIKKYSNQINQILIKYNNLKNIFYSKLSNLKPTIIRKNELTSIDDFINPHTNLEIKPKKIEIYFIDGMIQLSYKIIKYEKS